MGVAVLASHAYTASSRFRARVSSDRLAEVQKANSQRFMTLVVLGVGLFCTYAAIRTLIRGVDTWWLWLLAAAAQFGVVALRRASGVKPVAGEVRLHVKMKHSHRVAMFPGARFKELSATRSRTGRRSSHSFSKTVSP